MTWPLYPQPPELEQLGRVVELDSDMADITQEPAQEPLAEDALAEEQEAVPASTHIASTQGINPYVLQVSVLLPLFLPRRGLGSGALLKDGFASPRVFTHQLEMTLQSGIELTHHISLFWGKPRTWEAQC